MILSHPCQCLSAWDRRDGRRCQHDSWGIRPAGTDRSWATPHDELPFPLFLIAAVASGVLFVALLLLGQKAVCAAHDGQHRTCHDYTAPTSKETP